MAVCVPKKPLDHLGYLHPRSIVKSVVYCQAGIRRFLAERHVRRTGGNVRKSVLDAALLMAAPPPSLAASLFFAKHLRNPGFIEVEAEAECVAAIICGREHGITLGAIATGYDEYKPHLPENHPVFGLFVERFSEVAVEADEEALKCIKGDRVPSEAEAHIARCAAKWEAPSQGPEGIEVFQTAKSNIQTLRQEYEKVSIERLKTCGTTDGYDAFLAEVAREFVGCPTVLRTQVREGRHRHKEQVELECSTLFGWPPAGPLQTLMDAGRKFRSELGEDHPVGDDFIMQVRRKYEQRQKIAEEELIPLEKEVLALRAKIEADPPPPKLLLEGYTAEYNERGAAAMERVRYWEHDLGPGSPILIKHMRAIMGSEGFSKHCQIKAEELIDDLRRMGPRPLPTLESADDHESRSITAVELSFWLEILDAEGWARCEEVRSEFAVDLQRAQAAANLYRSPVDPLEQDEDWHKPPGFEFVEGSHQEAEVAMPEESPASKKAIAPSMVGGKLGARQLPGLMDTVELRMRLHGVDFEDVRKRSEILLLEQCGDLIAAECGIPRHCISNLKFWDPRQPSSAAETSRPEVDDPSTEMAFEHEF